MGYIVRFTCIRVSELILVFFFFFIRLRDVVTSTEFQNHGLLALLIDTEIVTFRPLLTDDKDRNGLKLEKKMSRFFFFCLFFRFKCYVFKSHQNIIYVYYRNQISSSQFYRGILSRGSKG